MSTFLRALTFLPAILFIELTAHGARPKNADRHQAEEFTRLQIFLDNANFGPGKIDGHDGEFTRKAVALFREAQGQPATNPSNAKGPIDTSGLELSSVDPVFIEYEITKDDVATVGALPTGPVAQAKVKWLPYSSPAEAIAEKFHTAIGFLKELNHGQEFKEGVKLKVPNVKPFELSSVKTLKPGAEAEAVIANELSEPAQESAPSNAQARTDAPALSIHVSTKESMLEVRLDEKPVAAFPVTVGSQQTVSPIGKWVVKGIAKLPTFRYDQKMLKQGERSANFHLLPPGPNNPVGVMWIALNKKGIGIHGTNDPDSIGRSASHGCIRLANWDVVKLAGLVKPGTSVTID
jgi:lipoprotein-anchoring transpeptidase ErfK/SrfK